MPDPLMPASPDAAAALLSLLVACATAAVVWVLVRRARSPRVALALTWSLGGSVALGTGLWTTHLLAVVAWRPSAWASLAALPAAQSWGAAVLFAAVAVVAAGRIRPAPWGAAAGGLLLLVGLGVVHAITGAAPRPEHEGALRPVLAAGATLLLLGPVYFAARFDERVQARARALSRSLRAANSELQRAVLYDHLTGLANRRLMIERLQEVTRDRGAAGGQAALLFVDLDGFKPMNDLFGHGFGDAVLCEVARRLQALARPGDTVARLGGDEFAVLLADIGGAAQAHDQALRVVAALRVPLQLERREARLSASVGIACYPADGGADRLLAAADAAMYEGKRAGGGRAIFFAAQMEIDARAQMELQRDLRRAIEQPERGELCLHYQPKVSARDGRVTGVEALLRWRHPERGDIGPADFVPVAERFGLIDRLGQWVIEEACRQIVVWQQQGLRLRVAVNLSMHQLREAGLAERVRVLLGRHGLTPGCLMFEITESVAMDDSDATGQALDALAVLGTELSVDDFGTGYSSLAYLRRLPSRQLKIDRSFVKDLESCRDALAIVEAVIRLAHALGLAVVAEGVETTAQRDLLRQLQCDEFQGFLFARPVPGETVARWALEADRPPLLYFEPPGAGRVGVAVEALREPA